MKFKKLITFLLLLFITCAPVFAETKFVKVVFVGDYRCGKTAIWKRLMGEGFNPDEQQSDTLTYRDIIRVDGTDILSLKIWDTAGLDKYYDEVVDFTKDANFVFIVHDLYKRLDADVRIYLSRIYRDVSERMAPSGKIVLVGSKLDLRQRDIVNSAAQATMLQEVAGHIPCAYVLTSAKTEGDPGIGTLLNYIIENSRGMALPSRSSAGGSIKFNVDTRPAPVPAPSSDGWCTLL